MIVYQSLPWQQTDKCRQKSQQWLLYKDDRNVAVVAGNSQKHLQTLGCKVSSGTHLTAHLTAKYLLPYHHYWADTSQDWECFWQVQLSSLPRFDSYFLTDLIYTSFAGHTISQAGPVWLRITVMGCRETDSWDHLSEEEKEECLQDSPERLIRSLQLRFSLSQPLKINLQLQVEGFIPASA